MVTTHIMRNLKIYNLSFSRHRKTNLDLGQGKAPVYVLTDPLSLFCPRVTGEQYKRGT